MCNDQSPNLGSGRVKLGKHHLFKIPYCRGLLSSYCSIEALVSRKSLFPHNHISIDFYFLLYFPSTTKPNHLPNPFPSILPTSSNITASKLLYSVFTMPLVYSRLSSTSELCDKALWIDDFIQLGEASLLTPTTQSFGFKAYIPSTAKDLLALSPDQFFDLFRTQLRQTDPADMPAVTTVRAGTVEDIDDEIISPEVLERDMAPIEKRIWSSNDNIKPTPGLMDQFDDDSDSTTNSTMLIEDAVHTTTEPTATVQVDNATTTEPTNTVKEVIEPTAQAIVDDKTSPEARAAAFNAAISSFRPLPFQYIWKVHYDKANNRTTANATGYTSGQSILLEQVPDIGEFYKVFNNFPWPRMPVRDAVHIFRFGVKPLWEDPAHLAGGSYTVKVRRDRVDDMATPQRVWEDVCLMGCGGELQCAVEEKRIADKVLGMSFKNLGMYFAVSVWLGTGEGRAVVAEEISRAFEQEIKDKMVMEGVWKWHRDNEGWEEAVGMKKSELKA